MGKLSIWNGTAWEEIKGEKGDPGDTQVFDIRQYPSPDDAITDAGAHGGGIVSFPAGTFPMPAGKRLPRGVSLYGQGSGATTFDLSGVTAETAVDAACISARGAITKIGTMGAAAPRGALSITLASAPSGVNVGDWLIIHNTTERSFHAERTYYNDGEYVRVVAVSGATITVATPLYSSYPGTTAVDVYRMAPFAGGIHGATIILPGILSGIKATHVTSFTLEDVQLVNGGANHVYLDRCVNIKFDGVDTFSDVTPTGSNYGVIVGNSQHIEISGSTLYAPRHGFTTGGGSEAGNVPNRDIKVIGGTIAATHDSVPGCDLHANTEYVDFQNVAMPTGVHLAGDHVRLHGGFVMSGPGGTAISITHNKGFDFDIDTRIVATRPLTHTIPALVYLSGYGVTSTSGNQVECVNGGTFRLAGDIDMGSWRASSGATRAIYVDRTGATATNADIAVSASVQFAGSTTTQTLEALNVSSTGVKFRTVSAEHLKSFGGAIVIDAAETATAESCFVKGSGPSHGIYMANGVRRQIARNNTTEDTGGNGIYLYGAGSADTESYAILHGNTVTNANRAGSTATTSGAAIHLFNHRAASSRANTIIDTRTTPQHQYPMTLRTIAAFRYDTPSLFGGAVNTGNIAPDMPWAYVSGVMDRQQV